jgi:hypothetical protein
MRKRRFHRPSLSETYFKKLEFGTFFLHGMAWAFESKAAKYDAEDRV